MTELGSLVQDRLVSSIALLLAILSVTTWYDRMPLAWAGLGLHRWLPRELLTGLGVGIGMTLIAWLPLAWLGGVAPGDLASLRLPFWGMYFVAGAFFEELLFRGYLFQRAVEIVGPVPATILGSALFAVAHLYNPGINAFAVINIFLAGVFFSLCYLRTGSLWLPVAAHIAWNFLLAKVFGLPVSGLDFGAAFLQTAITGPEVITGGLFGPEGGVAAALALAVGGYVVARTSIVQYSPYVYAGVFKVIFQKQSTAEQ